MASCRLVRGTAPEEKGDNAGRQPALVTAVRDNYKLDRFLMLVLKKISSHKVWVEGTQSSGWSPVGATNPVPLPVHELGFNLEIQFDGFGYLLCYASEAGNLYGYTWHETLEEAEESAAEQFGGIREQWRDA